MSAFDDGVVRVTDMGEVFLVEDLRTGASYRTRGTKAHVLDVAQKLSCRLREKYKIAGAKVPHGDGWRRNSAGGRKPDPNSRAQRMLTKVRAHGGRMPMKELIAEIRQSDAVDAARVHSAIYALVQARKLRREGHDVVLGARTGEGEVGRSEC